MDRERLFDRWARAIPPRYLRPVALPIGRHLSAEDGFRFESARMINTAFGYVWNEGIKGDYAEFGVFRGRTFIEAWLAIRRYELHDVSLHAYDSFEGLPAPNDTDGPFTQGQFSSSRELFEAAVAPVPRDRMTITEGWFDKTLPDAKKRPLAVAWVDCDLYESTVPVLDFLADQLQDGSVLVFDDWYCFHGRPDRGEQRACAEWLDRNPDISLVPYRDFHALGRAFLVNRR